MYTEFYNLAEKPFDLTHSSRYLYLGEGHKEALAMLTYGVIERKGFVLLTGEVGTGKTTILHALLADLDRSVQCVHLANPLLSPKEFMNYLTLSAFKNRVAFKSKAEFLLAFEAFLTRCSQQQRSFLLLVDEAHKLSFDLLEEIRLLSNMETAEEKLINIFLVGQPELNKKLSDQRCRALLQRISIRYQIKPLSREGTEEYILTRLRVAGASKPDDIFSRQVRKAIHEYSKGYPRMINILSDNLLLLGYAREERRLTTAMVRECFEDLRLEQPAPVESIETETVVAKIKSEPRESSRNGFLKWVLVGLLAILLGVAAFFYGEEIRARVEKFVAGDPTPSVERPSIAEGGGVNNKLVSSVVPSGTLEASLPDTEVSMTPSSGGLKKKDNSILPPQSSLLIDPPLVNGDDRNLGQRIIVKEGDTLEKLAKRIYGRVDDEILIFVQDHNPAIADINFIRKGSEIYFPPLLEMPE